MRIQFYLGILFLSLLLSACGGNKNVNESSVPVPPGEPLRSATPPLHEVYQGGEFSEQNIDGWQVRCKKDQTDNSKYCLAAKEDLNVGILFTANGTASHRITIGSDTQYPGSEQILRIDSDAPVSAGAKGFDDAMSRQIIERMKSAGQVITRYRTFSGSYMDKTIRPGRFSDVLNYMYTTLQSL